MASSAQHVLLSPAELAYLHASLSLTPPIRPDGRSPTQFRPLIAETGVLPGANGSARICFADGTEAVVGVKAEVEKTAANRRARPDEQSALDIAAAVVGGNGDDDDDLEGGGEGGTTSKGTSDIGENDWVEITVEIPGYRDDDAGTVFLAELLGEALLADGEFARKLWINSRFHWKLYLDILLISAPLSYPLPLLSLTTHLALLATRLPRLKSEGDEDPFFDDDWDAAVYLYPRGRGKSSTSSPQSRSRPSVTLLVMAVGDNIIFDPAREELAVASTVLAVSVAEEATATTTTDTTGRSLRLLSVRTIDPPSRLTPPGIPNTTAANYAAGEASAVVAPSANAKLSQSEAAKGVVPEGESVAGVWRAPRGGAKLPLLAAMIGKVLEKGGVADEIFAGLDAVELG